MLPTQRFDTDDDRGVSPVIGVILMVAITVILAAVIASFVLGLGQGNDPAPSPTVDSSVDNDTLTLDVTGGDDFDADVATVQGSINGESFDDFTMDEGGISDNTVGAGDTVVINASSAAANTGSTDFISINDGTVRGQANSFSATGSIDSWEIEIIWNPSDQDSSTIYSDSSD